VKKEELPVTEAEMNRYKFIGGGVKRPRVGGEYELLL
jgi:hypothetical protein